MANENISLEQSLCKQNNQKTRQKYRLYSADHVRLGKAHPREYQSWQSMIRRCTDTRKKTFHQWGGRGIKVSPEWMDFVKFFEDMGKRPLGHTLDRINNDLNYCKENCRWADQKVQTRNTRRNIRITIDGVTKCVSEWAEHIGIPANRIYLRLLYGWSDVDAVMKPAVYRGHEKRRRAV